MNNMNSKLLKLALAGCLCAPIYTSPVNAGQTGNACKSGFFIGISAKIKKNNIKYEGKKDYQKKMAEVAASLHSQNVTAVSNENAPYIQNKEGKFAIQKGTKDLEIDGFECTTSHVSDATAAQVRPAKYTVPAANTYNVVFPDGYHARTVAVFDQANKKYYPIAINSQIVLVASAFQSVVDPADAASNRYFSATETAGGTASTRFISDDTYASLQAIDAVLTNCNGTAVPSTMNLNKDCTFVEQINCDEFNKNHPAVAAVLSVINSNQQLKAAYDKQIEPYKIDFDNKTYLNVMKCPDFGISTDLMKGLFSIDQALLDKAANQKFKDYSGCGLSIAAEGGCNVRISNSDWAVILSIAAAYNFWNNKCNIYNEGEEIPETKKEKRKEDAKLGPTVNLKYSFGLMGAIAYNITSNVQMYAGVQATLHRMEPDFNKMQDIYNIDNLISTNIAKKIGGGKVPDTITKYNNELTSNLGEDKTVKINPITFALVAGLRYAINKNVSLFMQAGYDFGKKDIAKKESNLSGSIHLKGGAYGKVGVAWMI